MGVDSPEVALMRSEALARSGDGAREGEEEDEDVVGVGSS